MRLDAYIQLQFPGYSRSLIQKLIKDGHVCVNGVIETKTGKTIAVDQEVTVDDSCVTAELPAIDLPVLYEDENCVVIDKPLGVLVHSKGAYNPEATVLSWLKERKNYDFPESAERGGIVHRLDRATSGVMICAKNKQTLGMLQKQFQDRRAKKTYMARIVGDIDPPHAQVDLPIERNPKKPQTFRVGVNGKEAQTEYKVLTSLKDGTSLVELKPRTGRTHQLRVHLAHLKHPIIGDVIYGGKPADRLYLHASELEITLPHSERMTFKSNVPKQFAAENL